MLQKLRILASDTLIYGLSTMIGRFMSFLLTPIWTNYLTGVAAFGEVSAMYSYIPFVNILFSFGLETAFFKFYSFEDETRTKQAFSNALLSMALVSGGLTLLVCLIPNTVAHLLRLHLLGGTIIQLAVLIAFFDALQLIPFAALRMARQPKRFATTKFLIIVVNFIANIVLVVWLRQGVFGIFLAGLISSVAGVLMVSSEIKKYLEFHIDRALLRSMFSFGLPTFPHAVSANILQVADRPILLAISGAAAVGIYQANYKLGIPMMLVVTIFDYAWKPFFLKEAGTPGSRELFARVLTYFTLFSGIVFLVTSFFIEYLVRLPLLHGRYLIPPQYWSGLGIIPIVLGAYFFLGVFTNLTAAVYIRARTKYLTFATGAAALANIVLNYVCDPFFGVWGAAWATLGAYFISACIMYCITRRIYPLRYEWKRIAMILGIVLAVFFVIKIPTAVWRPMPAIAVRLAGIGLVFVLLHFSGFFAAEEIAGLKKMFRRK